jgi:hypothetical protein
MGVEWSSFFGSTVSSHFLTPSISDETKQNILCLLEELPHLIHQDHVSWPSIEHYLTQIPRGESILSVTGIDGYNLLQWSVGLKCQELVKWILNYGVDVNRGSCSLPLHIAALNGCQEIAELLVRYGARTDVEVRMCFPAFHSNNCELRRPGLVSPNHSHHHPLLQLATNSMKIQQSIPDRSQDALFYAIDGDRADLLDFLIERSEETWIPFARKKPLLYTAFERKAWNCVKLLLPSRQEEVNQCFDEYFPIHQAVLHDVKFVEILLQCNVDLSVRTATQQLTVLHVLLLLGKKSAADTMSTLKLLLDHGAKELINEPDSLGNTPLHALIVRYALEEFKYGSGSESDLSIPWTTWDMLHLMRYLLQQKASPSINRKGNSALACVLRHVRDWEFRFELLTMLLQNGGNPNCVGRDGSVPLIVCLVPLLNKGLLHFLNHNKKVSYLNCIRILCKHGANPNCSWRTNLTPLHVLVFTACEYITMRDEEEPRTSNEMLFVSPEHTYHIEYRNPDRTRQPQRFLDVPLYVKSDEKSLRQKKEAAFDFINQVLGILLQHDLDPNVVFSQRNQHILLALLDVVQNARTPTDLEYVYQLSLKLIQYGADPNIFISNDEPTFCSSQGSVFIKKPTNYVSQSFLFNRLRAF